jgi:hypothetical protein
LTIARFWAAANDIYFYEHGPLDWQLHSSKLL